MPAACCLQPAACSLLRLSAAWLAACNDEMETVKGKRLRELHGEERERVIKNEKVIGMRMNPEPKKGGRCKMRLLVRGDLEPKEWNIGKKLGLGRVGWKWRHTFLLLVLICRIVGTLDDVLHNCTLHIET